MTAENEINKKRPTVLWIDDEAETDKYSSALEIFKKHLNLEISESCENMADRIHAKPPHVVVLDIVFGKNHTAGIELLRDIRSKTPQQRIMVVTGNSYEPDLNEIEEIKNSSNGLVRVREKPYRVLLQVEEIKEWLAV